MKGEEIQAKLNEFRSKLSIDPNRLEDECVYQSALYAEVGEFAAELRRDAKVAKERLDYEKARLQKDVRTNPANYGISGKTTEGSIEEAVLIHADYRKALSDSIDASYIADCANVLTVAVEQRKSMIKDCVTLWVHEYYGLSQNLGAERKTIAKVSEEEIVALRRDVARRSAEEKLEEPGE